eukprot:TRINITY_DN4057_c0_g2_i1.p1 TRINITY_DN4057_c0_g2~~TRINITY_DN4057_c0_g2_i1.p1  ORF type:complete len:313 (+),score=135.53 TRINITY_DN4057_c0_g2_i1:96-1034(+)
MAPTIDAVGGLGSGSMTLANLSDTAVSVDHDHLSHSVRSRRLGLNLTVVATKEGLADLEKQECDKRMQETRKELKELQDEVLEKKRREKAEEMKGKKVKKGFLKVKNKLFGALDTVNHALDVAYFTATGKKDKAQKKAMTREQIEEYKMKLEAKREAERLCAQRKKEAYAAAKKAEEEEDDESDTSIGNRYKWYQLRKNAPWVPIAQDEDPTEYLRKERQCGTSGGRHRIRVKQAFSLHAQYNEEVELSRTMKLEQTLNKSSISPLNATRPFPAKDAADASATAPLDFNRSEHTDPTLPSSMERTVVLPERA